jgi:hypothetical protein
MRENCFDLFEDIHAENVRGDNLTINIQTELQYMKQEI